MRVSIERLEGYQERFQFAIQSFLDSKVEEAIESGELDEWIRTTFDPEPLTPEV